MIRSFSPLSFLLLFSTASAAFLVSVLSAWMVRVSLTVPFAVVGDWFVFRHAENPGIAFGVHIPSPWKEILILGALALVAGIALKARTTLSRIGYGLILGGALANVVDRLVDGTVTDFIAVGSFPVFNIPDSCISVGIALLLVESLIVGRRGTEK